MKTESNERVMSGWFAGPKAENGEWFADTIRRILQDYHSWRRNYFPEDGVVVDSQHRRASEPFQDAFEDRLMELLGRLKADFPFYSPRYAAHMISEQSLPSIAGYIAAMLYNPNNVSSEGAPVTVRLELEASQMIARMLGYGPDCWAHLTSGGTIANIEAMWIARTVKFLPLVVRDMRRKFRLDPLPWPDDPRTLIQLNPLNALNGLSRTFSDAFAREGKTPDTTRRLIGAYRASSSNVVEHGMHAVSRVAGAAPIILVPETHHYCFEKAADILGFGRSALRAIKVDSDFRMSVADLSLQLDIAESHGSTVIAVIAVVGTTEEGAVDPVNEILELRSQREAAGMGSFWLHADAAYGGYLRTMTLPERIGLGKPFTKAKIGGEVRTLDLRFPERGACEALERLGECDSITIDPHKLGFIPYPAGAVCFKSNLVKPIARQDAPYLEDAPGDVEAESKSQGVGLYILEGSKPGAAAAAVWLSHKLIPLDNSGHGLLVRETIRNAYELHALLEGFGDSSMRAHCLCLPGSNIVCYAFAPRDGGATLAELNTLNDRIYRRFTLHEDERVYNQSFFVSRTTLSSSRYSQDAVQDFLDRLGAAVTDYQTNGVFLLRSVLMNPWYAEAKARGRYFLSELTAALFEAAEEEWRRLRTKAAPAAPTAAGSPLSQVWD
jgi:glutamate/tyrosine decarboxylase-like PLP-dependent enzyme